MSIDWVTALLSTSLVGLALWFSRSFITEHLKNSIKHDYEKKIENLRDELRKSEASFKFELRAKESEVESLRKGALSGIVTRHEKLYQRKIQAADQLWGAIISLGTIKYISKLMATINFETVANESARNPQFKEIFSMIDKGCSAENIDTTEASIARPFLPPLVWALFSAYRSIIIHAYIKMQAIKSGVDKDFTDVEGVARLVKEALPDPEYTAYIEKHGPSAYYYLLETLETKMLSEIEKVLKDESSDKESIEAAGRILKESDSLN